MPPDVVLITGPAGAGKTTVAEAWAGAQRAPTTHISLDDVRDWVKSGYADPSDGWTAEAREQYRLARRCVALAVREHLAAGYRCVIDDAVFPDRPDVDLTGWQHDLGRTDILVVVLTASRETLAERNRSRSGHRRLSPEMLGVIDEQMAAWSDRDVMVLDTTSLDVAQTVATVDRALRESSG